MRQKNLDQSPFLIAVNVPFQLPFNVLNAVFPISQCHYAYRTVQIERSAKGLLWLEKIRRKKRPSTGTEFKRNQETYTYASLST